MVIEKKVDDSNEIFRSKMWTYVHKNFLGDYRAVANVLKTEYGKKVSTRTIQSWLIGSDRISSRRCPEWAVKLISEFIQKNPDYFMHLNNAENELYQANSKVRDSIERARFIERNNVKFATNSIAYDQAREKKWTDASMGDMARLIFELETKLLGYVNYHNTIISLVTGELRKNQTFDEFKSEVGLLLSHESSKEHNILQTKNDILERQKEFSNDDGLLDEK